MHRPRTSLLSLCLIYAVVASAEASAQGTSPRDAASRDAAPRISLKELMGAAAQASRDYPLYAIDLELAGLKKGKADIEAKSELDKLNAESTYQASLAGNRSSRLSFYNSVVQVVFDAATAGLDSEAAALQLENAVEDEKYATVAYEGGLSSEVDLKEARIARKTAETSLMLARRTAQAASDAVASTAGLEWREELLPAVEAYAPDADAAAWIAKDAALANARLAERIASLKLAALAANAPKYDRRIQETEVLKAGATVAGAEDSARRSFETAVRNLDNQAALLQIRAEELEVKTTAYEDSLQEYKGGLISSSDLNLKRISVITARKSLLQAQASYLKTVGSFKSAMGDDPLGL